MSTVLLIDNNPKYIVEVLPLYGYTVQVAQNCRLALDLLKYEVFDLILLDINLSDIDGFEFIKTIRNTTALKDIPIIVVSEDKNEKNMVKCLKIGADDYIFKPFSLPNLLARMEAVMRRAMRVCKTNVTKNVYDLMQSLTAREKDVLLLVRQGKSNKSIAEKLILSEITVKSHLNNIFKKLHVTNRTQAVLLAMQTELIAK